MTFSRVFTIDFELVNGYWVAWWEDTFLEKTSNFHQDRLKIKQCHGQKAINEKTPKKLHNTQDSRKKS